jgi:hypothetical protein
MIGMVPDTPDDLSGTTSFEKKYPQIADISISITETISGLRREYLQAVYRDIKKFPEYIPAAIRSAGKEDWISIVLLAIW